MLLRRQPATIPAIPPPSRPAQALTAAARRLDLTDRNALRKVTGGRPLPWQRKAWDWYDELGEIRFAAGWIGDALSRLRIVPAWRDDPSQPPTILTDDTLADLNGAVTPEALAACQAAIARLEQGPGHAEMLRLSGIDATIPGEWYIVGRVDDTRGEVWEVHAVDAITVNDTDRDIRLCEYPDQPVDARPVLDPRTTVLIHIMRRHPRWVGMPDSPMRGALEYCEDLRILRDSIRGTAMSRMNAGIFGVPKEATFSTGETHEDDEGTGSDPDSGVTGDPLTDALIAHMSTPIADPRSASAVVPFLLRLYGEDLDKVQQWDFARDIDRLAIDLREEARRSIAGVMDLPAEIMLGMGDTNHWTAWQITEDAFRIHIEPLGQMILSGITEGYYRQVLDASGFEDISGNMLLWYDPTDLVSKPDEASQVEAAYDRIEVSGAYYRRVLGIPEDAAPDDDELERRKALAEIRAAGKPAPPGSQPSGAPAADSSGVANPEAVGGTPTTEGEPAPEEPPARTASASPEPDLALVAAARRDREWTNIAVRMGRMEISLRDRLRVAANELLDRGLERAGNRLRSLANKDKAGLARRAVASVPASEVAMSLGPAMVASLGVTEDDLLAGAFDALRPRWDEWVRATQREAFRMLRRNPHLVAAAGTDDWEDEFDAWEADENVAADRDEGWALLAAGLGVIAAAALFGRTPATTAGESDSLRVPPGVVREALRRAGGTSTPIDVRNAPGGVDPEAFAGLLSGPHTAQMMLDLGREFTNRYVWLYGDPSTRTTGPFEPHEALDGNEFESFDSDTLVNTDAWPPYDFYFPGDHDGCQCEAARMSADAAVVEPMLPLEDVGIAAAG